MVMCLWSSQPGFLNESSTLTILICSLFTSQHPLVSGFNRSHSNISSGLFLPLRKCRTSVSYSVFMVSPTYVDKAHPSGKSQKRGSFWPKNGKNIFFFFFGMDYAWPSVKCEWPVCPSVFLPWKQLFQLGSLSPSLHWVQNQSWGMLGQETKWSSPCAPSIPPLHTSQHQRTNLPSTIPLLPSCD